MCVCGGGGDHVISGLYERDRFTVRPIHAANDGEHSVRLVIIAVWTRQRLRFFVHRMVDACVASSKIRPRRSNQKSRNDVGLVVARLRYVNKQ